MTAEHIVPDSEYKHRYRIGDNMLHTIASRLFNLEISEQQRQQWQTVFSVMFNLDMILDSEESPETRLKAYDKAINFMVTGEADSSIDPNVITSLVELRQVMIHDGRDKLEEFATHAHTIALLGERSRQASNIESLGLVALAEGRVTSRFVTIPPEHAADQDVTEFNDYLTLLTTYANSMDTLFDMKSDAANGLVEFNPSIRDHWKLIKMQLPSIITLMKRLDVSTFLKLSHITLQTFADRKK
ncbi:MAG: hypothetical protein ABIP50_02690 [Candidatus Saccharimonadales bacterium]